MGRQMHLAVLEERPKGPWPGRLAGRFLWRVMLRIKLTHYPRNCALCGGDLLRYPVENSRAASDGALSHACRSMTRSVRIPGRPGTTDDAGVTTISERSKPDMLAGAEGPIRDRRVAAGSQEAPPRYTLTEETRYFPKMVVMNTCYPCNAECPHCPFTPTNSQIRMEERARQFPFIPWDLFKRIADEVGAHKAILRFSGAGEPLLHAKCVDMIEYAKAAGCQVGLITNGSRMSAQIARRLLDAGTEMIEFSVDAADAATYDVVRKGLRFDQTLANIRRTVAMRNDLKAQTRLIVSVVDQQLVHAMIPEIVAFWDQIVDTVQIRKYLTWDINDLAQSGDITPYLDPEAACPFPFDRLLIDSNGEMRFCVYDIKAQTNWGNVAAQTISSVWTGPDFESLRTFHNKRELYRMEICEKCLDRQFRSWDYNYFHLRERAEQRRQERIRD